MLSPRSVPPLFFYILQQLRLMLDRTGVSRGAMKMFIAISVSTTDTQYEHLQSISVQNLTCDSNLFLSATKSKAMKMFT